MHTRSLFSVTAGSAFLLLVATACKPNASAPQMPPAMVTVARLQEQDIVESTEFTGRVEPIESVEVRPRVSGYIQEVKFQSGQLVRKGDVLFIIDPRWHQATFEQRKAEVEEAKVRLDNARREAERIGQLLTNNAISVEESDARKSRHEGAMAALLAAQAALDSAKLDLEYTQVHAPISGRVSRALLTEGNYVSGIPGAASLMTTLVSVDPIYVYADIDENSLLKFNALAAAKKLETDGDGKVPVQLQLGDEADFPHRGAIESFDNRLNADTGSILLRAVFQNPDGRIVPGLFARIRVPLSDRHPALLVDERAIGTDQARKFVFTLTATNTVAYRPIELGPLVEGRRVVRSGLNRDEKVVVNGLARIRPGAPVNPQEAIASAQTSARAHDVLAGQ